MAEVDIEPILPRARARFPGVSPRILSDDGPPLVAKDFQEFLGACGRTPVTPSPYYPPSNGKLERSHRTIPGDGIRPESPLSLEDARRIVARYVASANTVRLHRALGSVPPLARLGGRAKLLFAEGDRKLEAARERRKPNRPAPRQAARDGQPAVPVTEPAIRLVSQALTPRRQTSSSR